MLLIVFAYVIDSVCFEALVLFLGLSPQGMATIYSPLMVRAVPGTVRCSLGTLWWHDKAVAGHCFKHLSDGLVSSTFSILELWLNRFYNCGVRPKLVLLLLPSRPFPNTFLLALCCTHVGLPIVVSPNCQASACPRPLGLCKFLSEKLLPRSAEASLHLCEQSPLTLLCFFFNTSPETLQIPVCCLVLGTFLCPGLPLKCESYEITIWTWLAWRWRLGFASVEVPCKHRYPSVTLLFILHTATQSKSSLGFNLWG